MNVWKLAYNCVLYCPRGPILFVSFVTIELNLWMQDHYVVSFCIKMCVSVPCGPCFPLYVASFSFVWMKKRPILAEVDSFIDNLSEICAREVPCEPGNSLFYQDFIEFY